MDSCENYMDTFHFILRLQIPRYVDIIPHLQEALARSFLNIVKYDLISKPKLSKRKRPIN